MKGPIQPGLYKTRRGDVAQVLTTERQAGVTGHGPFFAHGKVAGVSKEVLWNDADGRYARARSGGPHYHDLVERVKTKRETMGGDGPPPDEPANDPEEGSLP